MNTYEYITFYYLIVALVIMYRLYVSSVLNINIFGCKLGKNDSILIVSILWLPMLIAVLIALVWLLVRKK